MAGENFAEMIYYLVSESYRVWGGVLDLKVLVENIGLRMVENCCVQIKMIHFCHRRKDSFGPKRSVCFGDVLESWCSFDNDLSR